MTRLPQVDANRLIRALKRTGFVEDGQRGSHLSFWHPVKEISTTVPIHGDTLHEASESLSLQLTEVLNVVGAPPSFGAAQSLPMGQTLAGMAHADLNGDGRIVKGELSLSALSVGRFLPAPARITRVKTGKSNLRPKENQLPACSTRSIYIRPANHQ